MERVFVYGTLRKGAAQDWRMAGGIRLGGASVRGRLYRIDWYPGLVPDESEGEVMGDLYEVSDELLEKLDEYEGDGYRRVRVAVGGGMEGEAWVWEWLGTADESRRIPGGDWLA